MLLLELFSELKSPLRLHVVIFFFIYKTATLQVCELGEIPIDNAVKMQSHTGQTFN